MANQLVIDAQVAEIGAPRFTPAGVPAADLWLEHASRMEEAGQEREVKARIRAVALGAVAESLARLPLGGQWRFSGFLASPRGGKSVVLHIQSFSSI